MKITKLALGFLILGSLGNSAMGGDWDVDCYVSNLRFIFDVDWESLSKFTEYCKANKVTLQADREAFRHFLEGMANKHELGLCSLSEESKEKFQTFMKERYHAFLLKRTAEGFLEVKCEKLIENWFPNFITGGKEALPLGVCRYPRAFLAGSTVVGVAAVGAGYKTVKFLFSVTPQYVFAKLQKKLAPFKTNLFASRSFKNNNADLLSLVTEKYHSSQDVSVIRACNAIEQDQCVLAGIIKELELLRAEVAEDAALVQGCDDLLYAAERTMINLAANADILQSIFNN